MATNPDCELCTGPGGELLWEDRLCRVVRVTGTEGEAFPGYCRVIWRDHVGEMSALGSRDAQHVIAVVLAAERALRLLVAPDKVNLASLGNRVPHLHWHVIPRWRDDSHFPASIWARRRRRGRARPAPASAGLVSALRAELAAGGDLP